MAENIEIKARVTDWEGLFQRAQAIADYGPEIIHQTDTFFHCKTGRLKLRVFKDGSGELIRYQRPDTTGPKTSDYEIYKSADPASLKQLLTASNGLRAVVIKERTLFLAGQTRIHLDRVEGLGTFMELEVVLHDDQTTEEGQAIAEELMRVLKIESKDLIDRAYVDLLEGS